MFLIIEDLAKTLFVQRCKDCVYEVPDQDLVRPLSSYCGSIGLPCGAEDPREFVMSLSMPFGEYVYPLSVWVYSFSVFTVTNAAAWFCAAFPESLTQGGPWDNE